MIQLDTRLPLGVQPFDLGAVQRNTLAAMQQRAAEQEIDNRNALATAMQTYGQGVLSPDAAKRSASIAGLAAAGPAGFQTALPLMQQEQQRLRPMTADEARAAGLRPGTVAMVNGLGVPQILQQSDVRSPEALAQELSLVRERAAVAGGPESFGAPQTVMRNGQPVLVQFGNRGTVREVAGGFSAQPPETGAVPIQGYDANGNPVVLFPNRQGGLVQADAPPGVTLTPQTREIRVGNEVVTVDRGGREISRRPIDSFTPARDAAAGRQVGENQGNDIANAPREIRTAETMLGQIDSVLNHRALNIGTGLTGSIATSLPGTAAYDFGQRVEQIRGQAFLQAFESLRGGGAITEREGEKATAAIARLSTAQSSADFRTALRELREVVDAARARAQTRVQAQAPAAPAAGVPIPGAGGAVAEPPPSNRPPLSSFQR